MSAERLRASLLLGWSLALLSSPVTISILILSSTRIGYRWYGSFPCLVVPLLAVWLLVTRFGS